MREAYAAHTQALFAFHQTLSRLNRVTKSHNVAHIDDAELCSGRADGIFMAGIGADPFRHSAPFGVPYASLDVRFFRISSGLRRAFDKRSSMPHVPRRRSCGNEVGDARGWTVREEMWKKRCS